jgi:hypothetical protein
MPAALWQATRIPGSTGQRRWRDVQTHRIEVVRGAGAGPWLEAVAALRIAVFRDWPYLYAGDAGYERD